MNDKLTATTPTRRAARAAKPARPTERPRPSAPKRARDAAFSEPASRPSGRSLFGTDGVRGEANVHPMTPELAMRLGQALSVVAARHSPGTPRVVIGKDTRLSGYMLETALAAGICSMGGTVLLCGPVPTPAVAHLTHSMRADAGIVISASHNPFEDNGIKVFGPDGFKLPDAEEAEIEALVAGTELDTKRARGASIGRAERIDQAQGRYIAYAKNTFPAALTLKGLRIVVDAANGAAYKVAPAVFHELGADVITVGCKPNGSNINAKCGALHPEALAREVLKCRADLGVALDGDADRVIVVDETGAVADGDTLMALIATRLLAKKALAKKTLVATVMSNLGLERAVERAGGRLVRTPVGDRYVVEEMRRRGYRLGGEQSGHLIFLDHATTGDGLVAALQTLAVMLSEHQPLSALARVMERFPQVLESLRLPEKRPLADLSALGAAMRHAEATLGKQGRVLVRWSGTEPKLRIMLEGPDASALSALMADLTTAVTEDFRA